MDEYTLKNDIYFFFIQNDATLQSLIWSDGFRSKYRGRGSIPNTSSRRTCDFSAREKISTET